MVPSLGSTVDVKLCRYHVPLKSYSHSGGRVVERYHENFEVFGCTLRSIAFKSHYNGPQTVFYVVFVVYSLSLAGTNNMNHSLQQTPERVE